MSQDGFKQAEDEFFRLKGQLATGRIKPGQFEAARKKLTVRDTDGRSWVLSADASIWQAEGGTAPSHPAAASARPATAQALPTSTPPGEPPPRRKRSCLGGCLRFFGILLLALIVATLILYFWPQIVQTVDSFKPGLRPGACKKIVSAVTSETASGDKLLCQFDLTDVISIEQAASRDDALGQIAAYTQMQRQLLATLATSEGFADHSTWQAESAIYDVQAMLSGAPAFTREGLLVYRDRYLILVRLSNWRDEAALKARWETLAADARTLIDDKFK